MPDYSAPPIAPKASWSGQTPVKADPTQGLILVPGTGVLGRTDTQGNRLLVDVATDTAGERFELFAPGAVTARSIGKWRNRRSSGKGTLAALQVNAGTAPTAGDASNYWRLVATDQLGNRTVLPISTAGVSYYDWDLYLSTQVANYTSQTSDAGTGVMIGAVDEFLVNQQLTVAGIELFGFGLVVGGANSPNLPHGYQAPIRVRLWDTSWTLLATGTAYSAQTAAGQNTWAAIKRANVPFLFDCGTVTLKAATKYRVTVDMIGSGAPYETKDTNNLYYASNLNVASRNGIVAGQPVTFQRSAYLQVPGNPSATPGVSSDLAGFDWPRFDQPRLAGEPARSWSNGGSIGYFAFLGAPSGISPFVGDLTFAFEAVGTPAAGAEPTDVNVRAVILP